MQKLLEKYHSWVDAKRIKLKTEKRELKRASNTQIRALMQFIYNRAVIDPEKLNQYEPFSPEVYGETSFELIDQMLHRVKLGENDIFLDLGSGE